MSFDALAKVDAWLDSGDLMDVTSHDGLFANDPTDFNAKTWAEECRRQELTGQNQEAAGSRALSGTSAQGFGSFDSCSGPAAQVIASFGSPDELRMRASFVQSTTFSSSEVGFPPRVADEGSFNNPHARFLASFETFDEPMVQDSFMKSSAVNSGDTDTSSSAAGEETPIESPDGGEVAGQSYSFKEFDEWDEPCQPFPTHQRPAMGPLLWKEPLTIAEVRSRRSAIDRSPVASDMATQLENATLAAVQSAATHLPSAATPTSAVQQLAQVVSQSAAAAAGRASHFGVPKNTELATAVGARVPLPPTALGAVELLTFFPHHTQWPMAGLRLIKRGWTAVDIAKVQLHARDELSEAACKKRHAALRWLTSTNGKSFFNVKKFKAREDMARFPNDAKCDARKYWPRQTSAGLVDAATLQQLAYGVVNWPSQEDSGIVTQAIQWAVQTSNMTSTTDDIPRIAAQQGFLMPRGAPSCKWDEKAKKRVLAIVSASGKDI